MGDRDGYIAGVPCWTSANEPDPEAVQPFYSGLFGWDFKEVTPPGSPAKYFIAGLRGRDVAGVAPQAEGAPPIALWNTYIAVESADEAADEVRAAGGQVVTEPFDVLDAGRMAVCSHPEGRSSARAARRSSPSSRSPPRSAWRSGSGTPTRGSSPARWRWTASRSSS